MTVIKKQKVLFICTGNSARSQMAEALLRYKSGDVFEVYSAGTQPDVIDIRALAAIEKFGIDTNGLIAKNITIFAGQAFDYVITLCDKANNECRSYPNAEKQLAWDFPDPKSRPGNDPFYTTLIELNNRLSMFILIEGQTVDPTDKDSVIDNLDPIAFYKSLSDDIRLKTLMLTHYHGELCVCELMAAMAEDSQPKVSRNLAVLKKAKVITDRKHGQWVFYRITPNLPLWAKSVIAQTTENNIPMISNELERLANMQNRPDRANFCK